MKRKVRDSFKIFLILSFFAHIILTIYFFISAKIDLFPKKHTYIKNAVRVDSIGLPELKQKINNTQSAAPQKKPTVQKQPAKKKQVKKNVKKKTVQLKKKVKKKAKVKRPVSKSKKNIVDKEKLLQQQSEAIEKLKALESIDQIKREMEEKPSYKGAKISKGMSDTGEEVPDFEVLNYFTLVRHHINMYWSLPQELAAMNLRAAVYVEIGNNGVVLKRQIKESSGNEEFDVRVLETIERASPFPRPVSSVQKTLSEGVVFVFPE